MRQRGEINLHLLLTIFLAIGTILFGVLAIIAYRDNTYTQNNLHQLNARAAADAATKQKEADDTANAKANELPYRTYTASVVNGSFQLQIPKNWSMYAGQQASGVVQLDLIAEPNVVSVDLSSGAINTHAFELQLEKRPQSDINRSFESKLKKKTLISKGVTISGIAATWFEGAIDDQRHNGVLITVPVRDKTMVISTDSHDYMDEFNTILASAKINP